MAETVCQDVDLMAVFAQLGQAHKDGKKSKPKTSATKETYREYGICKRKQQHAGDDSASDAERSTFSATKALEEDEE
ncbi:hypothetical protein Daus18300_009194 [Diaporthe australafricana]|uniref:Uncharacterized protein n=1 Tax=Diaporthe australafricana TaxID=127596 RepID=A0ABR3WF00_9PEZI